MPPRAHTRPTIHDEVASDAASVDIREWERENARIVPDEVEGSKPILDEDDPESTRLAERPPVIKPPSVADRARQLTERARKLAPAKKGTVSKLRTPRVPVDNLISTVWGFMAQAVQPFNMPVARVVAMQSPVAGMILEDVVKNTVVDRMLQPVAKFAGGGEVAIALLGPPLIVAAMTSRPNQAAMLIPVLRSSLKSWVKVAGPKLEKVAQEEAEFEEKYGSSVDNLISYILGGVIENEGDKDAT